MFKNYFVLNRHVIEMSKIFSGFILVEAFTQEKDKLILSFKNDSEEHFIEINVDQTLPYFIFRERFNRAKKNTLDFFETYLPSKLNSIKIAKLDRIIQFNLENFSLYFYIRGKETNVFLIDKTGNIQSFKKLGNKRELIHEVNNLNFIDTFQKPELKIEIDETFSSIFKKYSFLGKELVDKLTQKSKEHPKIKSDWQLQELLSEVKNSSPTVYRDDSTGKYKLTYFYNKEALPKDSMYFDNVNDALKYFIIKQQTHEMSVTKAAENKLEKKLSQLEKRRDHLAARIKEGSKHQRYQEIANLLLMNIDKLKTGKSKVELENVNDPNKMILITLNPKLKPGDNVEYYFHKAKSERKEFEKLNEILIELNNEISKLKTSVDLSSQDSNIPPSHKATSNQESTKNSSRKNKFRQFLFFDKYMVYVGKNSKNNDDLTIGFAKQNDYWFHARSVSGSHVVLRYDKSLGDIQKSVLEKVASLAAFYSKAKTSGLVPVSFTQKKYVVKRKGMEPGKVALLKEKVLIVKPEIPKECKFVEQE